MILPLGPITAVLFVLTLAALVFSSSLPALLQNPRHALSIVATVWAIWFALVFLQQHG